MSEILIINLRRFGDIISSAHLINSLAAADPGNHISLLINQEFEKATEIIRPIEVVYAINRKHILTLFNNEIFSDALALEEFWETLSVLKNKKWDKIINYSNDPVSTYLTSYLLHGREESTYVGLKYAKNNIAIPSSDWAIIFNDVLTSYPYTPIHFLDCYHKMADVAYASPAEILLNEKEHESTVRNNFKQIRQKHAESGQEIKIIGLQLKTSESDKDIPFEVISDLIDKILDHPQYYPVLLIAPNEDERTYAAAINKNFMNSLVTIEADFLAVTSVIKNLDLLLTPDTVIKHIADLLEVPTIEIALGAAPFLKQGTCNPGNLLLRSPNSITAEEIIQTVNYFFNKGQQALPSLVSGRIVRINRIIHS